MNKTDRELLEAAAKAAGIELRYWAESQESFNLALTEPRRWWNPLTDDGDALRLAVRLGLSPEVHLDASQPLPWLRVVHRYRDGSGQYQETWEHVGPKECAADPYAATRRAIVRAAAAMGENKNGLRT